MATIPPITFRWEQIDSNTLLIGRARLGTQENEANWQIKKLDSSGVYFANGSSAWNLAWSDRAAITIWS